MFDQKYSQPIKNKPELPMMTKRVLQEIHGERKLHNVTLSPGPLYLTYRLFDLCVMDSSTLSSRPLYLTYRLFDLCVMDSCTLVNNITSPGEVFVSN